MNVERDYGYVYGGSVPNNSFNVTSRGQVYQATHGGDGSRLPFMNRSFISFTYGGKAIEDFNLIATISNNKLDRQGYSSFNDLTTSYEILDGQQYWGTHYTTNNLQFTLSTDGMDQKQLDEFLHWFIAGEAKELILAEHPNRAQMARVQDPPQLQLLPFETNDTLTISGVEYPIKTTMYRGDIILKLVMDEPHWYAVQNILGVREGNRYVDKYVGPNGGNPISIFESQDALKILYEDGIPLGSMIENNMLLGNGAYANVEEDVSQLIWDPDYDGTGAPIANKDGLQGGGACINGTEDNVTYVGIIAGAIVNIGGDGIEDLEPNTSAYFFYAGTAPAPTILSFTLTPELGNNNYVITPRNKNSGGTKYNTITIGSTTTQKLYFTTPNILTSYNKAIEIIINKVQGSAENLNWEAIREQMREDIRHPGARKWAIKVIDFAEDTTNTSTSDLCSCMSYFLKNSSSALYSMTCSFNSKTGEAIGNFKYRQPSSPLPQDVAGWSSYGTEKTATEDIGDMIRSNYLVLKDRNYPTANGRITKYTSSHKEYSHYIQHNFNVPITNLVITYNNMYL